MTKIPHMQGIKADKTDIVEALFKEFEEWDSPARRLERKRFGAQCSHVTRRLMRDEPLTGKVLEFALGFFGKRVDGAADPFYDGIVDKLKAGTPLDDYEKHILIDVRMLHARLGSR